MERKKIVGLSAKTKAQAFLKISREGKAGSASAIPQSVQKWERKTKGSRGGNVKKKKPRHEPVKTKGG